MADVQSKTLGDLGRMVKAKYPAYASYPDEVVGFQVRQKFPNAYSEYGPANITGDSSNLSAHGKTLAPNMPGPPAPTKGPGFMDVMGNFATHGPSQFMDFITGHPLTEYDKYLNENAHEAQRLRESGHPYQAQAHLISGLIPGSGSEAVQAGQDFGDSNIGGGAAHTMLALMPFMHLPEAVGRAPELGPPLLSGAKSTINAVKTGAKVMGGAAEGGVKAFQSGKSSLPALAGAGIGELVGGPKGAAWGAAAGALPGTIQGMWEGGKNALHPPEPVVPRAPAPTHRLSTNPYNPQPEAPPIPAPTNRLSTSPYNPQPDIAPIPAPTNRLSTSPYNPQPESPRAPAPTSRLSTSPYNPIEGIEAEPKRVMPWFGRGMATSPYNPKAQKAEAPVAEPIPPVVQPQPPMQQPIVTPPPVGETVPPVAGTPNEQGSIGMRNIPAQKAHDMIGDWQAAKNKAAAETAFATLKPDQLNSLMNETMSKADLDSLLQKTPNPRTGKMYTATELASDMKEGRVGRGFEVIRSYIAAELRAIMSQAGSIPPVQ